MKQNPPTPRKLDQRERKQEGGDPNFKKRERRWRTRITYLSDLESHGACSEKLASEKSSCTRFVRDWKLF